jgi:hypothetical protein
MKFEKVLIEVLCQVAVDLLKAWMEPPTTKGTDQKRKPRKRQPRQKR